MTYLLKLLFCSAAALVVSGLTIAYSPWDWLASGPDFMLFGWLSLACVALPGLTWWGTGKLLGVT